MASRKNISDNILIGVGLTVIFVVAISVTVVFNVLICWLLALSLNHNLHTHFGALTLYWPMYLVYVWLTMPVMLKLSKMSKK